MNSYSFFNMVKDISVAIINSDLAKILCGALIGLLANPLLHHFTEIRTRKIRKIEILENIQLISGKYVEYLVQTARDRIYLNFLGKLSDLEPNNSLAREEAPRAIGALKEINEKLIDFRGELRKLYMSYKIFFGKDQSLGNLINAILTFQYEEIEGYEKALNIKELIEMNNKYSKEVISKISAKTNEFIMELLKYLDAKIPDSKNN